MPGAIFLVVYPILVMIVQQGLLKRGLFVMLVGLFVLVGYVPIPGRLIAMQTVFSVWVVVPIPLEAFPVPFKASPIVVGARAGTRTLVSRSGLGAALANHAAASKERSTISSVFLLGGHLRRYWRRGSTDTVLEVGVVVHEFALLKNIIKESQHPLGCA